ncbi:O-antigen ligase [mine drainage metagenome]|uniref:O-antigen ligase n=1 Tax=mine drainage metagenome TaxID=410659 RepID=A0A1J5TZD3_9ZZZZ
MILARQRYLAYVEMAVMALLLMYPGLMLAVQGGMNGVFLLTLLLALAVWLIRPSGVSAVVWQHEFTLYTASMFGMSAAIFISQTHLQAYTAHPYDAASRYWLGIPVFLLLSRLHPKIFATLQTGFPVAAIVGLLMAQNLGVSYGNRTGISRLDLIHYGDFELILGVMSLFSIDWFGRDGLPLRMLKGLGFIAGVSASFVSGTRGGWLAIPVFIAIFIYFKTARISWKMLVMTAFAGIIAIALAYFGSATFQQRTNELIHDVSVFNQGSRDTSTGIRWQLYKAAAEIFSRHPVFGVGLEGFALEMNPMVEAGKITPLAAELGRGEVHNDILSKAAGMGIFGLAAMLAIYFVPFGLFWRAAASASGQVRRSGILGITFVSGFFVFGLTVEFLNLTMSTAFYSFTVAVLLAACYNIHNEVVHKIA